MNRYPDRFIFGTDEVAPPDQGKYLKVYNEYGPLWTLLDKETSEKVRKGNYERIFDEARRKECQRGFLALHLPAKLVNLVGGYCALREKLAWRIRAGLLVEDFHNNLSRFPHRGIREQHEGELDTWLAFKSVTADAQPRVV